MKIDIYNCFFNKIKDNTTYYYLLETNVTLCSET